MENLHRLLLRQLRRSLDDPNALPDDERMLLGLVSAAYEQFDDDRAILVLCSQSIFRFADLGDDGLCRGGPDKGCGVIVSAIDVVVDRLD